MSPDWDWNFGRGNLRIFVWDDGLCSVEIYTMFQTYHLIWKSLPRWGRDHWITREYLEPEEWTE